MSELTREAYTNYCGAGKGVGFFELPEGKRVLEIGVGTGRLLRALRDNGNEVHGVDVSSGLLEQAREDGFEHLHLLDISDTPLPYEDNFFDAVFAYEVFEHLTNPHRMCTEIRRVLKPECHFYMTVPAQEIDMGYGPGRHTFVYPGLLQKENIERFLMQMYFRVDASYEPGPKDRLLGRGYILANVKHAGQTDVVEVITQDANVRDLYGDIVDEVRLVDEIKLEVDAQLSLVEDALREGSVQQAQLALGHVFAQYPDYVPAYPKAARILLEAGKTEAARGLLETVIEEPDLPPELAREIAELAQICGLVAA